MGSNFRYEGSVNDGGSTSNACKSNVSHIINNCPSTEDVEASFVAPHDLDEFKLKYLFDDKKSLKIALGLITFRKDFQYKTLKSNLTCADPKCVWYVHASRYKKGGLWIIRKYINIHAGWILF